MMSETRSSRTAIKSRNLFIGVALTSIFAIAALISLIWTPYDVTQLDISSKLKSPSWEHLFGTDHFGRDTFSMVMVGAQTSISVAFIAVGIGMGLGVPLGLAAAAYRGGLLDEFIMRGNDLIRTFLCVFSCVFVLYDSTMGRKSSVPENTHFKKRCV